MFQKQYFEKNLNGEAQASVGREGPPGPPVATALPLIQIYLSLVSACVTCIFCKFSVKFILSASIIVPKLGCDIALIFNCFADQNFSIEVCKVKTKKIYVSSLLCNFCIFRAHRLRVNKNIRVGVDWHCI